MCTSAELYFGCRSSIGKLRGLSDDLAVRLRFSKILVTSMAYIRTPQIHPTVFHSADRMGSVMGPIKVQALRQAKLGSPINENPNTIYNRGVWGSSSLNRKNGDLHDLCRQQLSF